MALLCSGNLPSIHAQRTVSAIHGPKRYGGESVVVLDIATGRIVDHVSTLSQFGSTSATPGSILKPLLLKEAIAEGRVTPDTTVACHRVLKVGSRSLACTHPQQSVVFTGEQALAYSCNSYFAKLAERISDAVVTRTLRSYGFDGAFDPPANGVTLDNMAQRQLLVLGLSGMRVTPIEVAMAYRKLALQIIQHLHDPALATVAAGLEGSVRYGMAHNAFVTGREVAGKTGTASNPGELWTHGWFAGFAPAYHPAYVVVVYVPRGNGADAAHLASLAFTSLLVSSPQLKRNR